MVLSGWYLISSIQASMGKFASLMSLLILAFLLASHCASTMMANLSSKDSSLDESSGSENISAIIFNFISFSFSMVGLSSIYTTSHVGTFSSQVGVGYYPFRFYLFFLCALFLYEHLKILV